MLNLLSWPAKTEALRYGHSMFGELSQVQDAMLNLLPHLELDEQLSIRLISIDDQNNHTVSLTITKILQLSLSNLA
jgi:hypothetical protein